MSSNKIDKNFVDGLPVLPKIGYFDTKKINTVNSASTLKQVLKDNCTNIGTTLTDDKDKYYNDTITGTINESCGTSSVSSNGSNTITADVNTACSSDTGKEKIVNHIKYLLCQLASSRNVTYDSSKFDVLNNSISVKEIFDKFSSIRPVMMCVFALSIYFLIQGFFSSFDVSANMINLIEKNSSKNITYYISLGLGIAIPVLMLSIFFAKSVCGNLESIEKYNITDDINGIKEDVPSGLKGLDTSVLFLFIFLIYGFIFVLFSISKESLGSSLYITIIGLVLSVISIFLYLFYTYIPFFATANLKNVGKDKLNVKLYVDEQDEVSRITSNQSQIQNLQSVFGKTSLYIFAFFVIYIIGSTKIKESSGYVKDIFSGLFGASAILIIPIIWVLNFILATKYFYIYPIVLLGFRFLRYLGMAILYGQYSSAQEYGYDGVLAGDYFSDDLKEELDDFSNYSPSYNLVGMDIIKTLMNIFGYENIFSKDYVNNGNHNLSSNKYVISGLFSYLGQDKNSNNDNSKNKLYIQGFIFLLTLIISSILLFSIYKV